MSKSKILIIDDDPFIRKIIKRVLKSEPYDLVCAENGRQGVDLLKSEAPDLIILDLIMPEMDGIAFLKQIRLKSDDPYAVIVLTGHGDDNEMKKCYNLGAHFFMRKPFGVTEFTCLIQRSLTLKRLEKEARAYRGYLETSVKEQNAYINKLSQALDQSGVSVMMTDEQGKIVFVNQAFVEVTGYSLNDVLGQTPDCIGSDADDDLSKKIWETITTGKAWKGEMLNHKSDGTPYWSKSSIFPVQDHHGKFSNYICIQDDITIMKEAEEAKINAQQTTAEFQKLQENFSNNVSHELLTPIHIIFTSASLLEELDLNSEQNKYLTFIQQSTLDLQNLVNRILNLKLVNDNNLPIHHSPFSVKDIFTDLSNKHHPAAEKKNLNFLCQIDNSVPEQIIGDELRIKQILSYLLGNAIKFTESGQVQLYARVIAEEGKRRLNFDVSDTGIGISAKARKIIFKPFQQADSSTSRSYDGLGLGLALVNNLITSLEGKISLESTLGEGSTFSVSLPFQPNSV